VRSPGEDEVAAHRVNQAWTASAISCATSTVAVRRAGGPVRGALPPNGVSPGSRIRQPQSCTHSDVTACTASKTARQLACRWAERGRGAVIRDPPSRYSEWRGWSPAHAPATPTGSARGLT
jgi:hypothetical protein